MDANVLFSKALGLGILLYRVVNRTELPALRASWCFQIGRADHLGDRSALAPSPTARNTESCKPNHKIQQFSAINSRMVTLPDLRLVIVKRRTYLLKALQRRSGTGPASPGLSMVPAFARDYEAKKNSSRSIL